jgi:hypothetical protein
MAVSAVVVSVVEIFDDRIRSHLSHKLEEDHLLKP